MIRKLIFILITLVFSIISVNAQFEWEIGMEWEFEFTSFLEPGTNKSKLTLSKDTIVDNKKCIILEREHRSCTFRPLRDIIYQEQNKIYYYHQEDSAFQLLYDFDAKIGDTLKIRLWERQDTYHDCIYMLVDSIEPIQFSNISLKKFYLKTGIMQNGEIIFDEIFYYEVIEGIGCTINLFYLSDNGFCDGVYVENIICFKHPTFGTYVVNQNKCELSTNVDELSTKDLLISVCPNPANNVLQFETEHNFNFFEIFDLTGKLVLKEKYNNKVEISMLNKGIYYIRFVSDDAIHSSSFVKI